MQNLLILSAQRSPEALSVQRFKAYALPHQQVTIRAFKDVFMAWDGQQLHAALPKTQETLAGFDAIHLPGWRNDAQLGLALSRWLWRHQIPFIGHTALDLYPGSKLGEMSVLTTAGIPYPMSFYASRPQDIGRLWEWARTEFGLQFPVVVKDITGSFGQGNFLVASEAELQALPLNREAHYLLQEFIPNQSDYRVLVMGGEVRLVIKRTRQSAATHANNTAQGASAELVDIATFDPAIISMALKAARALGRSDMAGVDVVLNETTGQALVLEVNRTPNLALGVSEEVDVAQKLQALFAHMDELAKKRTAHA